METENEYWQSYSLAHAPGVYSVYPKRLKTTNDREEQFTQVSIVLDSQARYDFSAIRLLIMKESSAFLENLEITGFPYNQRSRFSSGQDVGHLSNSAAKSNRFNKPSPSPERTCTISLKATYSGGFDVDLVNASVSQTKFAPNSTQPSHRFEFDVTYPVSSSSPSLLVLLRFNKNVSCSQYMHSFRILPVPARRPDACITLPPSVIWRIVLLATDDTFRERLFSYSLVCKEWARILDFFFERFGEDLQPVETENILHMLRWRPRYAAFIRRLECDIFYTLWKPSRDLHATRGVWSIMKQAKSLSYLHLPILSPRIFGGKISDLYNLRHISEATFGHHYIWDFNESITIEDVQTVIKHWPKLKKLSVIGWGNESRQLSRTGLLTLLKAWKGTRQCVLDECSIEQLELYGGFLTREQLLYFSSSKKCNLEKIELCWLEGPSNADFRRFLSAAASTVKEIVAIRCDFSRSHQEEFALDAIMPALPNLEVLRADDSVISVLSLIRKQPSAAQLPEDSSLHRSTIVIEYNNKNASLEDVEKAIRVSEWASIKIEGPKSWDTSQVHSIEEMARCRGTDLKIELRNPIVIIKR